MTEITIQEARNEVVRLSLAVSMPNLEDWEVAYLEEELLGAAITYADFRVRFS